MILDSWRITVAAIALAASLGLANVSARAAGDDIRPVEDRVLFTIPACRMPGKSGALVYHFSGGYHEWARGVAASGGQIYVWDTTRVQEFDEGGQFLREYVPPDPRGSVAKAAIGVGGTVYMKVNIGADPGPFLIFEPGLRDPKQVPLPAGASGLWVDTEGHLWMSARGPSAAYELDERGELLNTRPSRWRSGDWYVRLGALPEGEKLRVYDEDGKLAGNLSLAEDQYPHPHLLQYYDGQAYLAVYGTEPEEMRSVTLYSISPEGLAPKIKLPARVLSGGYHQQLLPNGTKYYVKYVREDDCYQIVRERYRLQDLGLAETPEGG